MASRLSAVLCLGLLVVVIACPALSAQGTAQISGTVRDQSGAVLPGVEMTATQTETGIARNTISNETGSYVLTNLPLGPHRLEAALPGFRTYVQSGIVLQVNASLVINPNLEVGQVTEQVEVQANAVSVETRNAGIGQVIENQRILELPLNGRQVTELIYLAGAAVFVRNAGGAAMPQGVGISVGGGAGTGITYTLDGALHSNPFDGLNLPLPFPDALQEFKVETGALSAQNGMHASGSISAVTKSGTNEFHGNLFEFVRNAKFNARNFFAAQRDSLKRNQFGGTIGGPIVQNKLFFFAGYQGTIFRSDPSSNFSYVPTAAMLAGDFTAFTSPACNAGRQIALREPYVNNRIDPSRYSRAALNVSAKLPKTDDPCGRVQWGAIDHTSDAQLSTKFDYQQSQNHSLFGRYLATFVNQPVPFSLDPAQSLLTTAATGQDKLAQSITMGSTYLLTANTINSFRVAVNRTAIHRPGPEYFGPQEVGINIYSYRPKFTRVSVTGGFTMGGNGQDSFMTTAYQVNDDVSIVRGNHQAVFGANLAQWRSNQNAYDSEHNLSFNGTATGIGMSDFLTGRLTSLNQAAPAILHMYQWYTGLFAADTWKISPRVTLNYGLRWEPFFPQQISDGRIHNFNYDAFRRGVKSTIYRNAPAGFTYPGDPGFPSKAGMNTKWADFGPRVGLGWDVFGDGSTSVRASFGTFYDLAPGAQFLLITTGPPWGGQVTVNSPAGGLDNPYQGIPGGNPFPVPTNDPNVRYPLSGGYAFPEFNTKPTSVSTWNLALQRQIATNWLVSATYLGSNTVHLPIPRELNPAIYFPGGPCTLNGVTYNPCSTTANIAQRRRLSLERPEDGQYIGYLASIDDGSTASYHGLLLSAQRRASARLTVSGNYTWSHCIDDGAGYRRIGGNGQSLLDPNNRRLDRGNCNSLLADRRHLFNMTAVTETPAFANPALRAVATGWKVSGIYRLISGAPLTVVNGRDVVLNGIADQRPNQVLENVYGERTLTNYLNPSAFAFPAPGTNGNVGRGTVFGPRFWQLDMAVSRIFQVREGQRLEFRAEAFNLPNHHRWGNPNVNLGSNTFGQITSSGGDARIMQFALKYIF